MSDEIDVGGCDSVRREKKRVQISKRENGEIGGSFIGVNATILPIWTKKETEGLAERKFFDLGLTREISGRNEVVRKKKKNFKNLA